jgi:archaemetzincin
MPVSETHVIIHRFGEAAGVSTDSLADGISSAFRVKAGTGEPLPIPAGAVHQRRQQMYSGDFLQALADIPPPAPAAEPPSIRLGLSGADLFIPQLNFVFGEADAARRVAVVSICRLRPEFYGDPPDLELFRLRLLKEAIHELGHVFGLAHCRNAYCIMHFSSSIAETDQKGPGFCQECQVKLAAQGVGRAV